MPRLLRMLTAVLVAAVVQSVATAQSPGAAPVTVQTTVDRPDATIGDLIHYTVTVSAAPGTEVLIPALSGRIGDFEIVDFGDVGPRTEGARATTTHWYTLRTFSVGDHVIPAPTIRSRTAGEDLHDASGNDVRVTIRSLVGNDPKADIRDIKPPEAVPFDWRPVALVGGVLAAGVGLFHLLNRPRRSRVVPPLPPDEVALAALARLRAARHPEAGRFETFYVELSAIVRRYLEDRFAVHAPEMTTEEFLTAAARDARLAAAQKRLLGEFLAEADLVKFARHVPTLAASETAFEAARRFVNDTRLTPSPEARRAAA